jgi:hypothetical protein
VFECFLILLFEAKLRKADLRTGVRATMVTAILPSLTDDDGRSRNGDVINKSPDLRPSRNSVALSLESELTITPERYSRSTRSSSEAGTDVEEAREMRLGKPSALAGYVGMFTGCGALVALALFLPLPTKFGEIDGVTPGEAVGYSFYVVSAVAAFVAAFVFWGLRDLKDEEGKGWANLFRFRPRKCSDGQATQENGMRIGENGEAVETEVQTALPYSTLLLGSMKLGFTDSHIALGYLGGFVARASTVAISLFIPLFVNTFFISNGFCHGSPNDPSPELKKECRAAYILASVLTGVAQLLGLICAPLFGFVSSRAGGGNVPLAVAALLGIIGYMAFPALQSPEIKDVDGRGGSPAVFLVVGLIGVSQIGAIVCSLGSLGRGVLHEDEPHRLSAEDDEEVTEMGEDDQQGAPPSEATPLYPGEAATRDILKKRILLKGSIAGVYSWCGGAAILLLTKLGGYLFDSVSTGAPFYMMAIFNAILLVASLGIDMAKMYGMRP